MGRLIDGKWIVKPEQTRTSAEGDFVRGTTTFRHRIKSAADAEFPTAADRYHLWVAQSCPWAHRTVIARALKGLQSVIGLSVAHYRRNEQGWWFAEGIDDLLPSEGQLPLHVLYSRAADDYNGSATVPVLWDRQKGTIVSNESADIIRILDDAFDAFAAPDAKALYPQDLRAEIDEVNSWVYEQINNGVYRCGFSRTQAAYDRAVYPLFEALDRVEARLQSHRYLVGDQITEADVRLFTTLIRFDAVYYGHFKCNIRRIVDYANLSNYLRDLYQTDGFSEFVDTDVYQKGYMGRSPRLNPSGIIPAGPQLELDAPHNRG